jgi:hypothetical protein
LAHNGPLKYSVINTQDGIYSFVLLEDKQDKKEIYNLCNKLLKYYKQNKSSLPVRAPAKHWTTKPFNYAIVGDMNELKSSEFLNLSVS